MRDCLATLALISFFNVLSSQKTIESTLKKFNNNSVPYVSVDSLKGSKMLLLFDTRKEEEFNISHIQNAIWVGYKTFEIDTIFKYYPDKNKPIVVYCSIGVRSEDIGEKLTKAGYNNVKNLYGGIFEWKNKGNTVYDLQKSKTEKVHAFSKQWGELLTNAEKVYTTKSTELEKP
ncbi:rhodanese-like domain-containing protein [uncultured Croceitalea sp.]|uniref:rhodanese-like domain-containing protein n=1 Tax=uncultured Croceitalea sp. TaxID=1798908 RepID=UPI003305D41A